MFDHRITPIPHKHIDDNTARALVCDEIPSGQRTELWGRTLGCSPCRRTVQLAYEVARATQANALSNRNRLDAAELITEIKKRQQDLKKEKERAPQLFEELTGLQEQLILQGQSEDFVFNRTVFSIRNYSKYHTLALCELLVEESWRLRFANAQKTLELARLATEVADKLPAERYGEQIKADLQARAWCHYANAQRIVGEYQRSKGSFGNAEAYLLQGSGDPIEEGSFWQMYSAWHHYVEKFGEAESLLDKAIVCYKMVSDKHRVGTAFADKGALVSDSGDLERGTALLRESLGLMEPEREVDRVLGVRFNLANNLVATGHLREAQQMIRELRPVLEKHGDRLSLARMDRLEGVIAAEIGHTSHAEYYSRKAVDEFMAQGIGYDAAECSLELAILYVAEARSRDLRQLATKMVPILEMQDMHKHAITALLGFTKAIELDRVNSQLVEDLKHYWQLARKRPDLKFRTEAAPNELFFD